ncbi:unnamed protein product [Zymoseptoria tritici ST99CH_3D1]|nr:unnamed protein product [Zymoseptoria tritici ST99CH_3D1]
MVLTFVYDIAKVYPRRQWVGEFVTRHGTAIQSRYLNPLDKHRKKADSVHQYQAYYDLIKQKKEQYNIETQNTYNMDEKGFLVGMLQKRKRVFTKSQYLLGSLLGNMQDGSLTSNIQSSWLQDWNPDEHIAFFASLPNGWTDNSLGLHWLTKVFEPLTRQKAGRGYRLLVINGHSSYVNIAFLQYCIDHRIFVAVFPPHSTHRLQPLDVSLFSPLASYYSTELLRFMHYSEGLSAVTKRDFFRLFWLAWQRAFTPANIASGFRKTGLFPLDLSVVVQKFVDSQSKGKSKGKGKNVHFSDSSRPGTADDNARPTTAGTDTSVISNN